MAFFQVEGPQGFQRADWHAGIVAATIANVHRDPKAQKKPYTPEDFLIRPPISQQERQEMLLSKVERLNSLLQGRDLRRN
jgi:hypothetical protein